MSARYSINALFGALCLSCVTLVMACAESESTQIVVLMDTDYLVPREADRLRARVATTRGEELVETWTRVFNLAEDGVHGSTGLELPATFGVLPDSSDFESTVVIDLEALEASTGRMLVSRRVRTGFVRGENRLIRLLLYRACEGVTCGQGETCGCEAGAACSTPSCVSDWIPPESLEAITNPGSLPPNSEFPMPPDDEPDGGAVECDPPKTLCGDDCVDTRVDPSRCGNCETVCPAGWNCEGGACTDPDDCRMNDVGCLGFAYCDEATGRCLRGCTRDEQCSRANEQCDVELHECVCERGFDRCLFDCVQTEVDPRFCGDCQTSCGNGEVCEQGSCIDPGDCRVDGSICSGFTYCDASNGNCMSGCDRDAQCPSDEERCDTSEHACVCVEGFHRCGAVCRSDDAVESCGQACTSCDAPPNSVPICASQQCDFVCNDDYERCGAECCPVIDPCTCEGQAIDCGTVTLCDAMVDCGACQTNDAPFCNAGVCDCADTYEANEDPASAAFAECRGKCELDKLDVGVEGSLDRASDIDFYTFDVEHKQDYALRVRVSGLESTPELFLTYVCGDDRTAIQDCSGSSSSLEGVSYCTADDVNSLELVQACGETKPPKGTVIVGVKSKPEEFVGPCDTYSLFIDSFFFDPDGRAENR